MVHSSPAIKQVYNCKANDVGRIVYAHEYKRLLTNRFHGKAAELAVLTEISVTTTKPIEYIYGKVEAKELKKPSPFNGWSLEMLPQVISLMHKYLFHIPYLARDNYNDNGYCRGGSRIFWREDQNQGWV